MNGNPNQVIPYQYSEPWVRPSPPPMYPGAGGGGGGPGGPPVMNNGVTPQFYCDNTNQVANYMYPPAVMNPFAPAVAANQNIMHLPFPRRQALLQIVDPNTGKNILDDILNNKPAEDVLPPSNIGMQMQQSEETRCQQNEENNLSATTQQQQAQQMMMMPAQHSVTPPWPQDLCQQQLQQMPDNGSSQQQQVQQQQQQMLEPVVVQVPVVVYLRDPA